MGSNRPKYAPKKVVPPTPCQKIDEEGYFALVSLEAMEFGRAVQRWRHRAGRVYPTVREILQIAKSLGYRKVSNEVHPDPPDTAGD